MPRLFTCVLLLSPLLLAACDYRPSAKDFASWCWQNQQHGDDLQGSRWLIYKVSGGPQVANGPILLRPYICANVLAPARFARPQDEIAVRRVLRREGSTSEIKMFALIIRADARVARGVEGDYAITVNTLTSVTTPTSSEQEYLLGRFEQAGAFDAYTDTKDGTHRPRPPLT